MVAFPKLRPWLRIFVVTLLVLGVCFRLYNLGGKVYWYDETMTSLRISGYTQPQFIAQLYDGQTNSTADLLERYQYPNASRGWQETWQALAQHPEHSPGYYAMARSWLSALPHSVTSIRLLSALLGLLTLPAMFWLMRSLFPAAEGEGNAIAWVTTALFAVSPFQVLYAQEAREYSLWTLTILVSSALLLQARRWRGWTGYGVAATAALYAHPFSALVLAGHGIYVAVTRKRREWLGFLGAMALAVLLFLPWLAIVLQNFDQFTGNTASVNADRAGSMPLFWLLNLSRVFFDLNQGPSAINPVHYVLAALAVLAVVNLARREPPQRWVFVVTLMGVTGLALIGPDVLLGGRRSSITRYAVPAYLGLQIAIGHFLGQRWAARGPYWRRWRGVAIALALAGVLSCTVSAHVPVWWHKSYAKSRRIPDVAQIVNQEADTRGEPLLLSDYQPAGRILTLLHELAPTVQIQLVEMPRQVRLPRGENQPELLVFLPSQRLTRQLGRRLGRRDMSLEPVPFETDDDPWLFRAVGDGRQ
ncbi:MAG: glycosyltransferase family 39 protein [Cyanobacteria bacterium P01_A01_bin.135]